MTHHGFIGTLSTSALLVSSTVAILLVVSAIVAFEGWPGPTADAPTETFLLEDRGRSAELRPRADLVLDPPPRERSAGGAEAAADAVPAEPGSFVADAGVPPAFPSEQVTPAGGGTAPSPGEAPLPGGGTEGDEPLIDLGGTFGETTDAIEDEGNALGPITDEVDGLLGGSTESVTDRIGGR